MGFISYLLGKGDNKYTAMTENNPWPGLSSYEDPEIVVRNGHKPRLFCGRAREAHQVTQLVCNNIFVTLYGQSGTGKTSLLNAGVFPRLRKYFFLPVNIRLSMDALGKTFQNCIIDKITEAINVKQGRKQTFGVVPLASDEQEPDYLWTYFARNHFYERDGQSLFPVIVLDQFEEVLRSRQSEAEALLRQISFLMDESHALPSQTIEGQPYYYDFNYRFMVSIREDDLYRLEDSLDKNYLSEMKVCRYRLRSLLQQNACEVILNPGEGLFKTEEQGDIANAIIEKSRSKNGSIGSNIISLLCSRIYSDFCHSHSDYITLAKIDEFLKGNPLERFYDEATCDFSSTEKQYIEDNLIDITGRRDSVLEEEFRDNVPEYQRLLEGEWGILHRISSGDHRYRIELIHDSFCDPLRKIKMERILHRRRVAGIIVCMMVLFLTTIFSLFFIAPTRTVINKWSNPLIRYAAFNDSRIWTQEDVKNAGGIIGSTTLQCDSDIIIVENDVHLEKLIVNSSHPCFKGLSNCPNLREITFTNRVQDVMAQCYCGGLNDYVTINIGDSVQFIRGQLLSDQKKIHFNLSPNNKYFQIGEARKSLGLGYQSDLLEVLWDKQTKEVLYIEGVDRRHDNIRLPEKLRTSQYEQIVDTSDVILSEQSAYAGSNIAFFEASAKDSVIGFYTFMNCKKLRGVNLRDIYSIKSEAFAYCDSLESVNLSKVHTLSGGTFLDCNNLYKVIFPNDFIEIGACAFDGCNNLREIHLPKVIKIDPEATFRRCSNLHTIILPDSIIANDFYAPCFPNLPKMFSFCHKLKNITFSEHSHFNWREDSVLYYDDYPAILNCCTNPNWASQDSTFYFENGILYMQNANEIYKDSLFKSKNRIFVDVFNGKNAPKGIYPPMTFSSRSYFFFESRIGETWPYLFLLSSKDTVITADQFPLHVGTFTIVNRNAKIKEIHLPYAEPKMVGLDLTQGTLMKENISLYVPFSHRKAYLQDPRFRDFKEIIEEDWKTSIYRIVKDDARLFFSVLSETESAKLSGISRWYPLLCTIFFMFLLFSLCFWMYMKSQTMSSILEIAVVSVVSWYVFYWLSFHCFSNRVTTNTYFDSVFLSSLCSLTMTILLVLITLFPKSLFRITQANKQIEYDKKKQ